MQSLASTPESVPKSTRTNKKWRKRHRNQNQRERTHESASRRQRKNNFENRNWEDWPTLEKPTRRRFLGSIVSSAGPFFWPIFRLGFSEREIRGGEAGKVDCWKWGQLGIRDIYSKRQMLVKTRLSELSCIARDVLSGPAVSTGLCLTEHFRPDL